MREAALPLRRCLAALVALMVLLMLTGHAPQQEFSPREVVIVVRDMGGTPLEQVRVLIFQSGGSFVDFVDNRTDAQGQTVFEVTPGEWIVAFAGSWRGYEFIELSEQNAGAMTNGIYGGFALYLDPQSPSYTFTFVVAMNDDKLLVPFYDLAEAGALQPIPFTYENAAADEISLNGAGYTDVTLSPLMPTPLPESAAGQAGQQTSGGSSVIDAIFLAVVLIFCGVIVVTMWGIIIVQSRNAEPSKDK